MSGRSTRGGSFAAAPAAPAAGGAEVTRQDDLTAWWKCEDTTEEIGGYDFTLNNGAEIVSDGSHGASSGAIDCDGSDEYFISSALDLDSATTISTCVWLKSVGAYTYGGNPTYNTADYMGFGILTNSTSTFSDLTVGWGQHTASRVRFTYNIVGAGSAVQTTRFYYQDAGWDAQDWTLWTMTWTSGDKFRLYRNNEATPVGESGDITGSLYDTTSLQFMFGKAPQYTWYTECRFDDIRVYGVQLSTDNISDIYNSGDGDW